MVRRLLVVVALLSLCAPGTAAAAPSFAPGAPGLGDEYFPLDGNGGYDVRSYRLDLAYDPATDRLTGKATIKATATQDLSRFNLDLDEMTVRSVRVRRAAARWTHADGELAITPARGIREGRRFTVRIAYDGVPQTLPDTSGFLHTDEGALAVGQPHGAATWYPANDHPSDKASYTMRITVPRGLEALSNGRLTRRSDAAGTTTWTWVAREPMASYLAMLAIGEFDVRAYQEDGIAYWDAIDPRLFDPLAPRTGSRYLVSGSGNSAYKRVCARSACPPRAAGCRSGSAGSPSRHGTTSSSRPTRPARTTGRRCRTSTATRRLDRGLVPGLARAASVPRALPGARGGGCAPAGTTGEWHAASGFSDGYEQWTVDLSAYAGQEVEVALSYASDQSVALPGVLVDDIEGPGGAGSTSFEDDGDILDGWAVSGPPAGSPPNPNDWKVGTVADAPPPLGETAAGSLERQPEVIEFLATVFGRYPFSAAGGIVDVAPLGFALETQTRPVYATGFFDTPESGDDVVVHELAHQWAGDHLTVARWRDIWLNEGFATYTEWLWSEWEGAGRRSSGSSSTRRHSGRRPVLDGRDRPPAVRGPALRRRRLRPRRDDPARPAARDRRRRLLPAAADVDARGGRRARDGRGVHPDRRGGERAPARRPLPDVALHAVEARGARGGPRCSAARRSRCRSSCAAEPGSATIPTDAEGCRSGLTGRS